MRKYKLCASVNILMYCLWSIGIFAQGNALGQAGEFRIVGKRTSPLPGIRSDRAYPLLNSRGEIVGSYKVVEPQDGKKYLGTLQNGASFLIDPLTYLSVSKDGNRIITYGDGLDFHEVANVKVKLYSTNGDLIKSLVSDIWAPFAFAVQDNGEFFIAAKQGYNGNQCAFAKYSSEGTLLWKKFLPLQSPMRLALAPDNSSSVLVLYDEEKKKRNFNFYNEGGILIHSLEFPEYYSGVEYIGNQRVVIYSSDRWKLYELVENVRVIASGNIKGNPLGQYPITGFPGGDQFAIVTLGDLSPEKGYRLQIIDCNTERVIAESLFEGKPYWQPYRFAWVNASGNIELLKDDEVIELEINR